MVRDALELACGGLHANAACPTVFPGQLELLVYTVRSLNESLRLLHESPDFRVLPKATFQA
jgi:hypothetical protein